MMKHRIGHIRVDVQVTNHQQAQYWSSRLQEAVSQLDHPVMSRWFDQQAPADRYVHIERLDLSLGELDQAVSVEQLSQQIFTALQDQLHPLLLREKKQKPAATEQGATEQWLLKGLEQYLLKGVWDSDLLDEGPQQAWHLLQKVASTPLRTMVQQSMRTNDRRVAARLALQWPAEQLLWLLPPAWIQTLHLEQPTRWVQIFGQRAYQKLWIELLIAAHTAEQANIDFPLETLQKWWAVWQEDIAPTQPKKAWNTRRQWQAFLPQIGTADTIDALFPIGTHLQTKAFLAKAKANPSSLSTDEVSSLRIAHAGLLIVYPFLSSCFLELGYLREDKKQFRSDTQQFSAMALLHFMAVGDHPLREEESQMYKLLCGIQLADPIPLDISISPREKEEAEQLLASVIEHWSVLGKTSLDGLRESFLQRPGSLLRDELSPVLYMEQQTIDVLLKKLPWGLSVLQLPWLPEFIRIEWPN